MKSPDFGSAAGDWAEAPATEFEILKQEVGKFVLVLDTSSSMDVQNVTRFAQLQQSTMRWIQHDISEGSQLGIVSFK